MYTDQMKRAFASLQSSCPRGFSVDLIDNKDFITIRMDSAKILKLDHDDKLRAVEYVMRVKDAFEQHGAIVMVTRSPLED